MTARLASRSERAVKGSKSMRGILDRDREVLSVDHIAAPQQALRNGL
jgi:hypothetical protein